MELNITWGELAMACGGILSQGTAGAPVGTLATDTRRLQAGQTYWALRGSRFDGHDFLSRARDASGWVIQRGRRDLRRSPPHVLEVPDTLKALQAFAAFHRRRFDIPVAAIAGSNGKTSTKEMLRSICLQEGPVCATSGNLNNQFGLPFSLLELGSEHRYGVFELGESRPGDIEELTRIAQPTAGVLTNVGPAHLEFFGDMDGVFRCLTELLHASPPSTLIALNLDDPWLAGLEGSLGRRAITYGTVERAGVRLLPGTPDRVELVVQRRRIRARLKVPGKLHRWNAAAAAAGAVALGLGPSAIAAGLEAFEPAPMRFESKEHASGAALILDAYNANPASMRAGIESFCEAHPRSRRILVLGDMRELGRESHRFHRELGEWLRAQPVSAAFLAGRGMAETAQAMAGRPDCEVRHGEEPAAWLDSLRSSLRPGAAVYFKASRAMQFERLIERL